MKSLSPHRFFRMILFLIAARFWMVGAVHQSPTSSTAGWKEEHHGHRRSLQDIPSFTATKDAVDPKLGTELTALSQKENPTSGSNMFRPSSSVSEEYISVDITFTSALDNERAKDVLRTAGVEVDFFSCFARMCSTRIPVSALKDVASIELVQVMHPLKAKTQVGAVTSEGDRGMFADIARSTYSVNGSGLLIGVMSDSYNCRGGAARDIRTGDLPSGTNRIVILSDMNPTECIYGVDEGRAMMQLIHDVAPGARLAFRTYYRGEADAAAGILELAAAGCDIIVDDFIYFEEPMFQDGIIAQAVNQVVSQGVAYFSAAGNGGRDAWVATSGFSPTTVNNTVFHQFGTDSNGSPIISMRATINDYGLFIFQ
jgi:hypothetical protein